MNSASASVARGAGRDWLPVLLLTAAVDVSGVAHTARHDPRVRLDDYRESLDRWVSCGQFRSIVLCENSGWDPSAFAAQRAAAAARGVDVEIICWPGQDFPRARGKGYGEMRTIAFALAHSRLIGEASHVFKCTGRYFVTNAARLVKAVAAATPRPDVACDLRDGLRVGDSSWFAGTPRFFADHLVPQLEVIDDARSVFFEHALARATGSALAQGLTWNLPPAPPLLCGVSGTMNRALRVSLSKRLRFALKRRIFRY